MDDAFSFLRKNDDGKIVEKEIPMKKTVPTNPPFHLIFLYLSRPSLPDETRTLFSPPNTPWSLDYKPKIVALIHSGVNYVTYMTLIVLVSALSRGGLPALNPKGGEGGGGGRAGGGVGKHYIKAPST